MYLHHYAFFFLLCMMSFIIKYVVLLFTWLSFHFSGAISIFSFDFYSLLSPQWLAKLKTLYRDLFFLFSLCPIIYRCTFCVVKRDVYIRFVSIKFSTALCHMYWVEIDRLYQLVWKRHDNGRSFISLKIQRIQVNIIFCWEITKRRSRDLRNHNFFFGILLFK